MQRFERIRDEWSSYCCAAPNTGTVQQIREEAKQQIQLLAPGGGYLFAPIHNISQEVPPENIIAFFEAGHWNY